MIQLDVPFVQMGKSFRLQHCEKEKHIFNYFHFYFHQRLCKTAENGSLSSVQSSGSDSSADRMHCDVGSDRSTSPQWKRKGKIIIRILQIFVFISLIEKIFFIQTK